MLSTDAVIAGTFSTVLANANVAGQLSPLQGDHTAQLQNPRSLQLMTEKLFRPLRANAVTSMSRNSDPASISTNCGE
jgi:hypothetical protein